MTYTEFDLVTFGEYLLSEERKKRVSKINRDCVNHADICNWKDKRKQEDIIVERMEQEVLNE